MSCLLFDCVVQWKLSNCEHCYKVTEYNLADRKLSTCLEVAIDVLLCGRFDEMGVLWTAVLNDVTIKNGLVLLRNRDTTVKVRWHCPFNI